MMPLQVVNESVNTRILSCPGVTVQVPPPKGSLTVGSSRPECPLQKLCPPHEASMIDFSTSKAPHLGSLPSKRCSTEGHVNSYVQAFPALLPSCLPVFLLFRPNWPFRTFRPSGHPAEAWQCLLIAGRCHWSILPRWRRAEAWSLMLQELPGRLAEDLFRLPGARSASLM
jgi:hypothetical protein